MEPVGWGWIVVSTGIDLDDAIRHARSEACGDDQGAAEHDQLAGWLEELRELRAAKALFDSQVPLTTVLPFTRWKHRNGETYIVVGIGQGCGGVIEGKALVVYEDLLKRRLWIRGPAEFLDGRFTQE